VFKILQYSEVECNCARKLLKGCLESTVRYNSISMKVQCQGQKYSTTWSEPPKFQGPRLQPVKPIDKSGGALWKRHLTLLQVKNQRFAFHSRSRVLNKDQNSYSKLSVKRSLACS